MRNVQYKGKAHAEFMSWVNENKKIANKIWDLIQDIDRNGVDKGIGKPEKLKYQKGWSRRITDEHRLIYNADEKNIYVFLAKVIMNKILKGAC